MSNNGHIDDQFLTPREASSFVGVTCRTLRRWEVAGKIKVARSEGGHRRYRLSDLKAVMKKVPATPYPASQGRDVRAISRAGRQSRMQAGIDAEAEKKQKLQKEKEDAWLSELHKSGIEEARHPVFLPELNKTFRAPPSVLTRIVQALKRDITLDTCPMPGDRWDIKARMDANDLITRCVHETLKESIKAEANGRLSKNGSEY